MQQSNQKNRRLAGKLLAIAAIMVAVIVFVKTLAYAAFYSPTGEEAPVAETYVQDAQEEQGSDEVVAAIAPGSIAAPTPAKPKPKPIPPPAGYPARLTIPALKIDTKVQQTTINARGAMGVPTNYTDVAWYMKGSVPGELGTAVIDGHLDNGLGLSGVFKHLSDIHVGNDIYITTYGGVKKHFVVTRVEEFAYDDADSSHIFDPQQGDSELKLVTCAGAWVPDGRTYDKRTVITAKFVLY